MSSATVFMLLALVMVALCLTATANPLALPSPDQQADQKRGGPPVRNPYSWMASLMDGEVGKGWNCSKMAKLPQLQPDKRSALRRPQNPYSWMAANEESGAGQWIRLRRLGAPARASISRNPYSWTNF